MYRPHRFILAGMALLMAVPVYIQGRVRSPGSLGDGAALPRSGGTSVRVRVAGTVPAPGIYDLPAGTTVVSAILLTGGGVPAATVDSTSAPMVLKGGEILCVTSGRSLHPVITVNTMGAQEKMLLGIPLDPNTMGIDDWDALPGIGHNLAENIVSYRHKNGDFVSLAALESVPGIGHGTIERMKKYF